MKAYGFRCDKCGILVEDTRARCLVYARNTDEAVGLLQDAIKEHDVAAHPSDQKWPAFTPLIFYPRKRH